MKTEKQIIKEFLTEIKTDIETIDGGCPGCISDFLLGVNPVIEKHGLKIEMIFEDEKYFKGVEILDNDNPHINKSGNNN